MNTRKISLIMLKLLNIAPLVGAAVFACVVTGLGFGVPTFLYKIENLPMPLAAVIHLGIGLSIYFLAASKVGWIPVQAGTLACVISVAGMILISLLIWLGFMKYNKDMAARINEALRKRDSQ